MSSFIKPTRLLLTNPACSNLMPPLKIFLFHALALTLLLSGCKQTAPVVSNAESPLRLGTQPDLSGHWEKNYQLSDDFSSRIALYVADIQRGFNTPQSRGNDLPSLTLGGSMTTEAINGLALFAEQLTRIPLLEIEQDPASINIERENDFTLRCHYRDRQYVQSTNPFGSDACGWNDQRLVFRMNMTGGLSITHQFSLSQDGSMLDLTTTVSSDSVSAPLIIRNLYRRFERADDPYNCQLTLTRNTVCSQQGKPL